jgi:protein phosphatase
MRAVAWGLTDVGLQREHNEDSFVVLKEYDLYVVADGMGGHRAGDVASKLATETISEFFRSTANDDVTWPFHFDANLSEEENRLLTGIRVANRQIFERSTRSREFHGMGTTVVGAMFSARKGRMYIGHVGDSRCYRIRAAQIQQLTRDHSLFNDYLLAMPDLTEEQRKELPKNVITRALGMQDQVAVDLQNDESQPGDVYVLCSDGLSGMVTDEEILSIVQTADMQEAPRKLIERANERGGEDNVTAVVIAIEDDSVTSTGEAKALTEEGAAMSTRSANAATEVPPPGSTEPPLAPGAVPATPPPPQIVMPKKDSDFADEPTLPAIDLRKAAEMGDEPTLPAIDLSKELSQIKKPRSE